MRIKLFLSLLYCCLTFTSAAAADANTKPEALARQAVSENPSESGAAIATLRAMGPMGLRALFDVYSLEIKRHLSDSNDGASKRNDASWRRLTKALDAVSGQRDNFASRLYWHTDFEGAKAAAAASGKPILSLRLLGKLDEEFSCANSRFFRTVLYANREVSDVLRERFILHWKSVRPAPRVTIDYGDGRKLERTLTGNSIHYILDASGRPVDALPGLYGPAAFLRAITQAEAVAKECATLDEAQRRELMRRYHRARINQITATWAADMKRIGGKIPLAVAEVPAEKDEPPSARVAAQVAVTKSATEINIINRITLENIELLENRKLQAATDNEMWNKIAEFHAGDAQLDSNSVALMRRHNSYATADATTFAALRKAQQLARLVKNFQRYIALDTVRNEYLMHAKLHAWFATGAAGADLEALNES